LWNRGKCEIGEWHWLGKKKDPISKATRAKMTGCVAEAVEHLPTKLNP
jgi:hypothetical protein